MKMGHRLLRDITVANDASARALVLRAGRPRRGHTPRRLVRRGRRLLSGRRRGETGRQDRWLINSPGRATPSETDRIPGAPWRPADSAKGRPRARV
jgi:hypothetical protein